VADFAADLGELMSSLDYPRFSVVGVSAGAPYALASGWALHDRITGLAAVSPLGPPAGSGASPGLRYRVPMLPFGSPRLGAAVAEVCLRALRFHRYTSARAMIDDYRVCRADWGFDPSSLRVPVTLWHGRADRLVPLSHALALAHAVRTCTTCVDTRGGHFFYSQRYAEIIGTLVPPAAPAIDPASVSRQTRSVGA
jgi:pimeloyl-ACP methyl ester carboxylesterase